MKRFDFELVLIMIRQSILLGTGLHSNNNDYNDIKLQESWQINMLTEDRYVTDDNDYREYKEDRCHWWDMKERYMTEMAIDQMLMKQNSKIKTEKQKWSCCLIIPMVGVWHAEKMRPERCSGMRRTLTILAKQLRQILDYQS